MGANSFGRFFTVTTFGESRSAGLGAVIDGCPAGIPLCAEDIQKELNRRKPGSLSPFSTKRNEDDLCEILSGVFEGETLGSPIAVLVRNRETSSKDYENLKDVYRPGHADYAYDVKYGHRDYRGGGRSSGRETIGRLIGGAVAKKLLEAFALKAGKKPIEVQVRAEEIAGLKTEVPLKEDDVLPESIFERLSASNGDSSGCVLSCSVLNVPEGLGSPVFSKLDAVLSQALMSIGAVKGIEIGGGFYSASITGSENNDISKKYSGGILGGISCDMSYPLNLNHENGRKDKNTCQIDLRLAVKAVPSIKMNQASFNKRGDKCMLSVGGNHDICLFPRIVPVVEAMCYLVLADAFLVSKIERF